MSKIYFVRHGESEWNVLDRICGATDIPLTAKGHEMAIETGEKILELGLKADYILSSPLLRASETARHISEITGIPMKIEERLKEQNFGHWEGTSPRKNPEFEKDKTNFISSYGSGESMLRLAQRIYNLLDDCRKDSDHTYILVAHNGIARVIKSYFEDMSNEEYAAFGVPNCSVLTFEFK
ncbi:MAG: histidine phosphatase family protein [Sphaerochaetaceae bacterium]|nr:histidine phosphatase family protein [Sphaerochaetaceae bacterium]